MYDIEADEYIRKQTPDTDSSQAKKWAKNFYDSIEGEVTNHEVQF